MPKICAKFGVEETDLSDIPTIIDYISRITKVPYMELYPLGSTGKKDKSSDVDLAVDITKYSFEFIQNKMNKFFRGEYNKGNRIGSFAVPVMRRTNPYLSQVDLMYVENIEWAQFHYYWDVKSEYKGAIRAILLAACAGTVGVKGRDAIIYDDKNDLLVRVGWAITPSAGLKRVFQMRKRDKHGSKWLKTMEHVTPHQILEVFPTLEFDSNDALLNNPVDVVHEIFGSIILPNQVHSVEEIINIIEEEFDEERKQKTYQVAVKRCKPYVKKGIKIPPQIMELINETK